MVGSNLISFLFFQVDSAKPFGENISEHYSGKSRRKSKFSHFPFPMRRGIQISCYSCTYSCGNKCTYFSIFFHAVESQVSLETWGLTLKCSPPVGFQGRSSHGAESLRSCFRVPLAVEGDCAG